MVRCCVPHTHLTRGRRSLQIPTKLRTPSRSSWLSFRNSLRLYLKHRPRQALGWIRSLFIYACSSEPPEEDILNRFRPFGPLRNALLVVGAVCWNALYLPETVRARQREREWTERGWPL